MRCLCRGCGRSYESDRRQVQLLVPGFCRARCVRSVAKDLGWNPAREKPTALDVLSTGNQVGLVPDTTPVGGYFTK